MAKGVEDTAFFRYTRLGTLTEVGADPTEFALLPAGFHERMVYRQARLKLKKERLKGLEEGISETGSGVLEAEWVDALIEDGQYTRAAEKIESELKNSRLQSSWLIRRGRVRLAAGKTEEAKSDLEAALLELDRRMNATSPDPSLLADLGMARELLGKKEEARKDYEQARDKGLTDEWVRDRIRLLKGTEDADKD